MRSPQRPADGHQDKTADNARDSRLRHERLIAFVLKEPL